MTTPPQWLTDSNLGSYPQDHSFYISPIVLTWISQSSTSVGLLNGALPDGMYWVQTGASEISVFGESAALDADLASEFTFRVSDQNGLIADQTFFLTITALIPAPSWASQKSFIGYHVTGKTETYQLTATTTTNLAITYSLILPSAGQSINSVTGVLTLTTAAANLGPPISIIARATTGTVYRDILLQYQTVRSSDYPYFITNSGEILIIGPGEYVEYLFEAYSPDSSNLTFSGTVPANYTLSSHGLLQGFAPLSNGFQTFSITVTNSRGPRTQSQKITISNAINYLINFHNTVANLGTVTSGEFYEFDLSATSTYSNNIVYSVSGGWLPPNFTLTPEMGLLQGFLDYIPIPREYHWQVTATDGINTVTQDYYINAYSRYVSQFVDFVLPVTGKLKTQLQEQVLENFVTTERFSELDLNVISGIKYNNSVAELLAPVADWLTAQYYVLGNLQVVGSTLWRNVYDHQLGADSVVTQQHGGTMYPQSLTNMRRAWSTLGFVSDGDGVGAVLQPIIDLEIGSFSSVSVFHPGTGYRYPPEIQDIGTGTGVVLSSQLGVVSAAVKSSTNSWSVGNTIVFETGVYNSPAILTVNSVDINNYITSLSITAAGLYTQAPISNKVYQETNRSVTIQADWGVVQVDVLAAGQGYSNNTQLDIIGTETMLLDQPVWQPQIHCAAIDPRVTMIERDTLAQRVWQTNHLVLKTQGIAWQGSTSYDGQQTSWDGGGCTFQDWIEPGDTIWDHDLTTWDTQLTTWDHQMSQNGTAYKFFQLDLDNMTWQQVYDQLYSTEEAIYQSDTLVEWLINMPTFALNSHNAIYTGNIALGGL